MKLKYWDLHIIKHALQHYICRDNPQEGDLLQEENLLNKVKEEINWFKENIIKSGGDYGTTEEEGI